MLMFIIQNSQHEGSMDPCFMFLKGQNHAAFCFDPKPVPAAVFATQILQLQDPESNMDPKRDGDKHCLMREVQGTAAVETAEHKLLLYKLCHYQ